MFTLGLTVVGREGHRQVQDPQPLLWGLPSAPYPPKPGHVHPVWDLASSENASHLLPQRFRECAPSLPMSECWGGEGNELVHEDNTAHLGPEL